MGVRHPYSCTLATTKECKKKTKKKTEQLQIQGGYHGCHGNPLWQLQCSILLTAGSWSHAETAQRAKIHWQHLARALLRVSYADEIFILCEEKHITDNSGNTTADCSETRIFVEQKW